MGPTTWNVQGFAFPRGRNKPSVGRQRSNAGAPVNGSPGPQSAPFPPIPFDVEHLLWERALRKARRMLA